MAASYGSLPFEDQIAFMRQKLQLPTKAWTDIYTHEHDWAFVVAGAHRDAVVSGFFEAVNKAIERGETLESFRKDFDRIVNDLGWDYKGSRNWRSQVIYDTNLFQSYNAGRHQQLRERRSSLPYLRYRHSIASEHPRRQHKSWDGLVLRADDPWWDSHSPANGWGCKCFVEGLSERDLVRQKLTVQDAPESPLIDHVIGKGTESERHVQVPDGIDPGFEYAPGRARLESAIPPERPVAPLHGAEGFPNRSVSDPLPPPRAVRPERLIKEDLPDEYYANAFLEEFGGRFGADPVLFEDVLGSVLVVGDSLFIRRGKKAGQSKANKRDRGKYMKLLAEAIKDPDEIWVRLEYQHKNAHPVVRRRYIAQFQLPDGEAPMVAVWEQAPDGWSGITAHVVDLYSLDNLRVGVRIFRKE
jgi:hypothetical protein